MHMYIYIYIYVNKYTATPYPFWLKRSRLVPRLTRGSSA